jgi:hypothetical protein
MTNFPILNDVCPTGEAAYTCYYYCQMLLRYGGAVDLKMALIIVSLIREQTERT